MGQLSHKLLQKELDQGILWPFYWIYGPEKFKSRDILKKIKKTVLGSEVGGASHSSFSWNEEVFEGSGSSAETIIDSMQSLVLSGGIKWVVVREAHLVKNLEEFQSILGPPQKKTDMSAVCVCLAKDLDGRKKFSKLLLERAAVVECEEVVEAQKEPWIQALAQSKKFEISSQLMMRLLAMDPWSLDGMDQELEKLSVAGFQEEALLQLESTFDSLGGADAFLESFFSRDFQASLSRASSFAGSPDEALPLLGLLGWNTRQMALMILNREKGTRYSKVNPYLAERFRRWSQKWTLQELIRLQKQLSRLDFCLKQTPLLPLGLWTELVLSNR